MGRILTLVCPVSLMLTSFALVFSSPHSALAQGVVSSTNVNLFPSAPPNVQQGKITSNTLTTAFQEKQNLTLTNALNVDISTPGTFATTVSLTPGTLAAGTQIDSFLFYTDPTSNTGITQFTGSLTFNRNILGLIVLSGSQDSTDALLGAAGTVYPSSVSNRGLEFQAASGDTITLSNNDQTLNYTFNTGNSVDEVRVITSAAVPEASTIMSLGLLLALGLGGVMATKKRQAA